MPLKIFNRKKGVVRGRSLAFVITVAVHVIILVVGGSFVALRVFQREEPRFEGKQLARPKMQIKKLQVPIKVKKIKQPKFQQPKAAPPKSASMDFKMPAMGGIKGGMGSFGGDGLGSLGFGMRFDTLFGGDASTGNELVGTFYDLKQTAEGKPIPMTDERFSYVIRTFLKTWKEKELEDFYQAPQKRNAISWVMPVMDADAAPDAFGVGDLVKPKQWLIHYKGEITAPETGDYRFCGEGDDLLVVRVKRKIVLDACFPRFRSSDLLGVTSWKSEAPETDQFPLGKQTATYGDWIRLREGQPVSIEILLAEIPGGKFSCHLLFEQKGKTYREVSVSPGRAAGISYSGGLRKVLPIFKMAVIPEGLKEKMKLDPDIATVDGPVFGKGW